ncbi:MAG: phosphopentomutase, partial [Planctomycetota bacterium]
MGPYKRIFVIVLDGVGIGALPDAESFGDAGVDTLRRVIRAEGPALPNLSRMGLAKLSELPMPPGGIAGVWGRMGEVSPGKDTTSGHWELMGRPLEHPFPAFPAGFPEKVISPLVESIGRGILFNGAASGTEIIQRFGDEHCATGKPIVYTSADSVFQIAAHEAVVRPEEL